MRGVERCEGDDEEGGGIFPSIHQVREGSLGVAVTPEALDEAEPGGQTLDDGAQTVRVAVAHIVIGIWNGRKGRVTPPRSPLSTERLIINNHTATSLWPDISIPLALC